MEQLKPFLDGIAKHHFWILTVVLVLAALYCWNSAVTDVQTQFEENQRKVDSEFQRMQTLARRPLGANVQVSVEIPDGIRIYADAEQISHALGNLLRNASEAMEHRGQIRLRAAEEGEVVRIRVEDDGPGIADSVMKQLFEPLVTTKASGIGLGLVVATTFVERNGGRLDGGNRDEGGAVFILDLPRPRS